MDAVTNTWTLCQGLDPTAVGISKPSFSRRAVIHIWVLKTGSSCYISRCNYQKQAARQLLEPEGLDLKTEVAAMRDHRTLVTGRKPGQPSSNRSGLHSTGHPSCPTCVSQGTSLSMETRGQGNSSAFSTSSGLALGLDRIREHHLTSLFILWIQLTPRQNMDHRI